MARAETRPPAVVDHLDLAADHDRGRVFLDGEDALVLDGNNPFFLRWRAGRWVRAEASLRGAPSLRPGAWYGALARGRALLAGNNAAYAVEAHQGRWTYAGLVEPPAGWRSIHGVALSPDGTRGMILHDLALSALARTAEGAWRATRIELEGKARGVALNDERAAVLTDDAVVVFERSGERWVQRQVLTLVPDAPLPGREEHLRPTGVAALDQEILAVVGFARFNVRQIHVFEAAREGWRQTAVLHPPPRTTGEPPRFAEELDLDRGRLLVGAPSAPAARRCGDAYLYERGAAGDWTRVHLPDPSACTAHAFGAGVAIAGERALVFAPQAGGIYLDGRNHPGRARRLYAYAFVGPAPAPFARLGVGAAGPADWVGELVGERRRDGRLERARLGVFLRISRRPDGVEASECSDAECSHPVSLGRLEEPADRISLTSAGLARRFAGGGAPLGVARGTLSRSGDRLVADLTFATGEAELPRARLELTPRQAETDIVALLSREEVVILERAPAHTWVGEWAGRAWEGEGRVPLLLRFTVEEDRLRGELCWEATRCAALPRIEEELEGLALQLPRTPRAGRWRAGPAPATLRRAGPTLSGEVAGQPWTLHPIGQRSPASFFELEARRGDELRESLPPARDCVCACYCGAAQPPDACPWDQCGCAPCPEGIP
ncbi:MAG: hypothetical protein P1V51_05535 [Deltaproteobacteria bacterium]|nr:hypothetical protein [Deltaproteobacteria bacterium]